MPHRVQRQRRPGWRKPDNTIIIDRTSRWGNPFDVHTHGLDEAIRRYAEWITNPTAQPVVCGRKTFHPSTREAITAALAGKDLACFCPAGNPCHGDVLIQIANPET
jgi:hypothetical protein